MIILLFCVSQNTDTILTSELPFQFFHLKLCSFFFLFQFIKMQVELIVLDPAMKPSQVM